MKRYKKWDLAKVGATLVCSSLLFGCNTDATSVADKQTTQVEVSQEVSQSSNQVGEAIATSTLVSYEEDDFYSDWRNESPTYIELEESVTITKAGVYVLSGKIADGQIVVDEQNKGTVKLIFNGVEIHHQQSAPVYVKSAGKVIITLAEGSENTISDGETYVSPDASSDEPNAAIFSKADLTINGAGKLTVQANYNNGITSKDDLKITGGQLFIDAADDGLMGKDLVAVSDGTIQINSGGDGIKSTNDTDEEKGNIVLEGGTFTIHAKADGIQAENSLYIVDGEYTITSGEGSPETITQTGNDQGMRRGFGNQVATATEEDESSTKGVKAKNMITITAGVVTVDAKDDAIHSDHAIVIEGGQMNIATGDDGIHADTEMTIDGGEITITKSYEGIESAKIMITNGEIHVTASDDGINISDGTTTGMAPGQAQVSATGESELTIEGGFIFVDASGDGLDSNGSIAMNGGTVIVNGPTNSGNAALDYDGAFNVNGGTLIASGSAGMAQTPSDTSSQYAISMNFSTIQATGEIVYVEDANGNKVATVALTKDFQNIVISSPEFKQGETYTLYTGGSAKGNQQGGLYTDEEYQKGTEIVSFEVSDTITWLDESGIAEPSQQRGFGGRGMAPEGFNGERPVDAGMTRPADAGMTRPADAGKTRPADAGMTPPTEGEAMPPVESTEKNE